MRSRPGSPLGPTDAISSGSPSLDIALGIGGRPYTRDRAFEFQAVGLPLEEVMDPFLDAVSVVLSVLEDLDDASLDEPYGGPEFMGESKARVLLHSVEHLGYHAGQIVQLAKTL